MELTQQVGMDLQERWTKTVGRQRMGQLVDTLAELDALHNDDDR